MLRHEAERLDRQLERILEARDSFELREVRQSLALLLHRDCKVSHLLGRLARHCDEAYFGQWVLLVKLLDELLQVKLDNDASRRPVVLLVARRRKVDNYSEVSDHSGPLDFQVKAVHLALQCQFWVLNVGLRVDHYNLN